ncbi:CPBP family intramembrane metalloprotease [Enemella dayhoffiae]|uniref:CPBP family intramembrane metalloprotease n=1 Tax=Enemella dayhoffiae TaxID=2016507 RepID=A0A255GR77_9ACTN|nr:type II CAAX endopeptidase family protein [Enemella dayhoffiae]OYO18308.1 CPBP family intramembrane metalloprotease [Enemella dayhoffiae]
MNPVGEVRSFLRASLVDPVPRDHRESVARLRRRRIVVAGVLLAGAITLGLALTIRPGDPLFYPATLGVAALWAGGAFASGRLHLGRANTRSGRHDGFAVLQGFLLGAALLGVFCAGALVIAQIPLLRDPVESLLDHARFGSLWVVALITALNGISEELFFRGAVFAALPRRWNLLGSTVLYAASTLLSGVPLLTFAAASLGLLAGAQRRVTGGVLGPIVSHLTWSLGMLFLLPLVLTHGG